MNILVIEYSDHFEVKVPMANGSISDVFTFDDMKQVRAFIQGFKCCKFLANRSIQELPDGYDTMINNKKFCEVMGIK